MIIPVNPEWFSDDSITLRDFLASPTGARLIAKLVARRPQHFADDANPPRSFARSRTIAGYEDCLDALVTLSRPDADATPVKEDEPLPNLDDDSKWDHLKQ